MDSTPEPELPDPVPATPDAVTPDLPPPGPKAPDIRSAGGERPRSQESGGAGASDEDGAGDESHEGGTGDESHEGGEPHEDTEARGGGRPPAGPGTPAPREQTD
ncbi:hypothetical protein [Streptomyces roseolus]|uniref:hypothetical protein n=1 Tax=Streptomyces roseolus TaxID=67358 RepID=UPI001678294E|nr:hypothetical protein [Streptomyces roseolus]GGR64922.1 hypothetical protein GCM10010282_67390 [Streptomyces roseolus]